MNENNPNPIVVGVGHDDIDSAVSFAATEAARAGCGVHLVHVVRLLPQGPAAVLVPETDLARAGRLALNASLERTRDQVGDDVPVTIELVVGDGVAHCLAEASPDARMIVLEHRDLSRASRIVTRSVTSGVAARARVPVVSVPSGWSQDERKTASAVTVGVDVPESSESVLRAAVVAARERGATLRVIHTWSFPDYYGVPVTRAEQDEWAARATEEIQAVLDSLDEDVADVPVQIDARHAYAADALVEASRDSDLLVLGRHDPVVPIGSHLGPIVRAVLHGAHCPVFLVDPQPTRRWHRHHERGG